MRRTNSFTLVTDKFGKLEVTVYEVRPLDLMEIHKEIQAKQLPLGEYERLLPFCINITKEQLLSLFPSEMEEVITNFKEVNKSFFVPWPTIKKIIEKVGLADWLADLIKDSKILETLKTALSLDLQKLSVSSPTEATTARKGTAGGISKSH